MNIAKLTCLAVAIYSLCGVNGARAAQADAWKADWERTVEAAKKEGQLTLYGSPEFEGLFGELNKKYPEIKITGVFNRGADAARRLMSERRADKHLADHLSQRHDHRLQRFLQSQGSRPDPAAADSSGSHRCLEVVARQTPICRPGKSLSAQLQRRKSHGGGIQYQAGEPGGNKIILGFAQSQVEREDRRLRSDPGRLRRCDAVFLSPQKFGSRVYQADSQRDRYCDQQRYAPDGRLAGGREVCDLDLWPGVANGFGLDADSRVCRWIGSSPII